MARSHTLRTVGAAMALAAGLSGCLLGPNYQRPTVDTPATYRFQESEVADTANTQWWQQFNDPVLNQLIATALAENKDVKVAAARVDQFLGQFWSTRSALLPQVGAGFNAGRERITQAGPTPVLPGQGTIFSDYQASVSASWEIDLFGRNRRLTESARANLLATEEGRRATILSLVASVASSYITLLSLDRQLEIAKATTSSRAESVHVFDLRFKGGEVSQMELAQSQSEYEASAATIPQLEAQIAQQEDALSVLLGHNPEPILRNGRNLDGLGMPLVPAGLPSELLERRPDLRQAEQQMIAANALIGAARALYFPSISLTSFLGTQSGQISNLFTGPSKIWAFAGSITQPIFTGGNITGQVRQAEAQQQQALYSYQKAIQTAFQEVDDALISSQKLREQLVIQGRQVEALRTYSKMARLRYEGGYTSYIEVLDAERSLFNAELDETRTHQGVLSSYVSLYKAIGGGWVIEAEKMTTQQSSRSDAAPGTPDSGAAESVK